MGAQWLDADDDAGAVAVSGDQGAGVLAGVGEAERFSGVELAQLSGQGGALPAGQCGECVDFGDGEDHGGHGIGLVWWGAEWAEGAACAFAAA